MGGSELPIQSGIREAESDVRRKHRRLITVPRNMPEQVVRAAFSDDTELAVIVNSDVALLEVSEPAECVLRVDSRTIAAKIRLPGVRLVKDDLEAFDVVEIAEH